ncbi:MAG TPA: hypothetical protein VFY35_13275 [Burkholderiaceae bacterium]|nr:hypothetical protein [Burkholderiaceae bacterium]
MASLPTKLLKDVYWSFAEPVPLSPEALVAVVREYAVELELPDGSSTLRQPLPFADVRIRYVHGNRTEGGEWCEVTQALRVVAPPANLLTGADLLWELHVACHSTVGADDRHCFEGFERVSPPGGGGAAEYEVILGS